MTLSSWRSVTAHFQSRILWLIFFFPLDAEFSAKERIHQRVGKHAPAERCPLRQRSHGVARLRMAGFDGVKNYASAIFRRGFGFAAAVGGSGDRAGVDLRVRTGS